MDLLDDLEKRVSQIISELTDIIQNLENDIVDSRKAIAFSQVKEIEASIKRMKKQNLPIPVELQELKIKLFSKQESHQKRITLYQRIQKGIGELQNRPKIGVPRSGQFNHSNGVVSLQRKPFNYKKPLGSKGYSNLEDYLIPVIKLMWNGLNHTEAFRKIAQRLDVRYTTVSAQCTKALNLTTDEFVHQVNSKEIVFLLKKKYSKQYNKIEAELLL
ncbi:MAG: hypothetical protein R6U13_07650 [Desulfatiglandaceae bacterium]